eukprot:TRINITY_DN3404_c0_g1_i1.p1 TRINITY_DN3404_c0_g1~~TRINITY_DN3404_c0_g1_i1.p1  ORF type:complete len:621 (+),score=122.72 TRINITY_DN3404_c0_g1_i1:99-1961(+)
MTTNGFMTPDDGSPFRRQKDGNGLQTDSSLSTPRKSNKLVADWDVDEPVASPAPRPPLLAALPTPLPEAAPESLDQQPEGEECHPPWDVAPEAVMWLHARLVQDRKQLLDHMHRSHNELLSDFAERTSGEAGGSWELPIVDALSSGHGHGHSSPQHHKHAPSMPKKFSERHDDSTLAPLRATMRLVPSEEESVTVGEGTRSKGLTVGSVSSEVKRIYDQNTFQGKIMTVVYSDIFEATFALLIFLNTLTMAFESQYLGLQTGYELGYPEYSVPATKSWPYAAVVFSGIEVAFGLLFSAELVCKMVASRTAFVREAWNIIDTLIILCWVLTSFSIVSFILNPMILRLVRLVRLLRFLRLVRTVAVFDVLRLLIGSLRASAIVLFWSFVLLVLVMLCSALLLNFTMEGYIKDESLPDDIRLKAFEYFGTFSRTFLTMFELTLANWVVVARFLYEVDEWFIIPILMYQSIVTFAVINVIRGVFLSETIKVAASDDELMIMQKQRQVRKHTEKMEALLSEADDSGDGQLDFEEFLSVMKDDRVKLWLSAMEIDISDPKLAFDLVCSLSGIANAPGRVISRHALVKGFARLKGGAKSFDVNALMYELRHLRRALAHVETHVETHA